MSTTVITKAGINAANLAGLHGPKIEIGGVKIGDAIIAVNSDMTNTYINSVNSTGNPVVITGNVFTGGQSLVTYQVLDTSTILFKVILDNSVGNFDIGNVGLFLVDGTLFSITGLSGKESKLKADINTLGNRRIFNIIIHISGVTNLVNLNVMISDYAALPVVASDVILPSSNPEFPVYLCQTHTVYLRPTLACWWEGNWYFIPVNRPGAVDLDVTLDALVLPFFYA